jgi:glycolate oxidase
MSKYTKIQEEHLVYFREIVGNDAVFQDMENLNHYSKDETEDLRFLPEVVVKPRTTQHVSALLAYCNQKLIPVTARGAGTGLSGGALPIYGGLVLSMEKFNSIIEIDERNLQATVEPGVINQVFQEAVKEKKLFYPPDPASYGSCFLGGNIAHCSGGPKAVKYGVTRDYVLNLEVVFANGEIAWTGANVLKNSTGYSLTHLLIGSEGTLGIVTKIVFKLIPLPAHSVVMLVPFFSAESACAAVSQVFKAGIVPSGMEFMERDAIDWVVKFMDSPPVQIKEEHQAHLLIELDGNSMDVLMLEAEKVSDVAQQFGCDEILFAENEQQKNNLWQMRRKVAESVKANSVYKEEDTVVPRAELPLLLKGVKEIGKRYGFKSVCYGHAGDGNLHVNILKGDMSDEDWNTKLTEGIREIFQLCVQLGGTISGEHGIGWVQKKYMNIALNATRMHFQKEIKNLFDPNGILNPGKIIE